MEISVTLAGASFRPAEAKDYIKHVLQPGDDCLLERDAANQYDERAVRILAKDTTADETIFIGFVPKSDNLLLSQAMDEEGDAFKYTCVCTGFMGTLQPTFDITFEPAGDDQNHGDD